MKVVANIQVGNEVEIIDHHIAYHKSIGVDCFVIVDLFSEDGTSEILDRYRGDPNFIIRRVTLAETVDKTGLKMPELGRWALNAAQEEFNADWIVRMDADEFIFPSNGDLKAALEAYDDRQTLTIERRNAIFKFGESDLPLPQNWQELSKFTLVSKPVITNPELYQDSDEIPLILTKIDHKMIVRAKAISEFTTGTHAALDQIGQIIPPDPAPDIISVHFWFTTLPRFAHKVRKTAEFEATMRKHFGQGVGWQWSRWSKLLAEGHVAIECEYYRQFLIEQEFQTLLQGDKICQAGDYWKSDELVA